MKFILRLLGIWLTGFAIILLFVDGSRTYAAQTLTTTSIGETWARFHAESWTQIEQAIMGWMAPISGQQQAQNLLAWPAWTIVGLLGLILLLAGRRRSEQKFIEASR